MTLTLTEYNLTINLVENQINELVIESPVVFRYFIDNLWNQINGNVGDLILGDKEKELALSKKADLIMNPFSVNPNDKKILTKLYSEIGEISREELFEQTGELNSSIVNYLDKAVNMLPYDITVASELDIIGLCKLYSLEIANECDSLMLKIENYIKIRHQILNSEIYFLINLKMYLTPEELLELYKFAAYEKVQIFIVSGFQTSKIVGEYGIIIDKDLCIIET